MLLYRKRSTSITQIIEFNEIATFPEGFAGEFNSQRLFEKEGVHLANKGVPNPLPAHMIGGDNGPFNMPAFEDSAGIVASLVDMQRLHDGRLVFTANAAEIKHSEKAYEIVMLGPASGWKTYLGKGERLALVVSSEEEGVAITVLRPSQPAPSAYGSKFGTLLMQTDAAGEATTYDQDQYYDMPEADRPDVLKAQILSLQERETAAKGTIAEQVARIKELEKFEEIVNGYNKQEPEPKQEQEPKTSRKTK